MPFRIILLKKYFGDAEVYYIKDMMKIETEEDLGNLKDSALVFSFYGSKFRDHEETLLGLKFFKNPQTEIKPTFKNIDNLVEIKFRIPIPELKDFLDTGYFYRSRYSLLFYLENGFGNFAVPQFNLAFRDNKGKETTLSTIGLMLPPCYRGSTIWMSGQYIMPLRAPLNFFGRLSGSEEEMYEPPGTIDEFPWFTYQAKEGIFFATFSRPDRYAESQKELYLTMKNFRPDEDVAFVSRVIDKNKIPSYSLIPPDIIQKQLILDGKINLFNMNDETAPLPGLSIYSKIYDKLYLPLPSLFSGNSFEIVKFNEYKEYKINYFRNPIQTFDLYIGKEAQLAWLNHELSSPSQLETNQVLAEKAKNINFFYQYSEHYPLRFTHDPHKDILANNTIHRDIYVDEHFIHLMPHTHDIPKSILLYDVLPEDLRTKFHSMQFCWIQYNTSKTVPDKEKTGYSSFKGEKLEPGRIHRSFLSIEDLKETKLHPEYGGSYYVLAACTKNYMQKRDTTDNPELWTIYTEGKEWRTLQDKQGKWLAYPYKINY